MMMKKIMIFLVTSALLLSQTALSETGASYEALVPTYTLIEGADPIREYMLTATLYVSENEIWFSGTSAEVGPWIVKTNAQGDILEQHILHVEPGERITVHGMSKTSNGLLLGIIDNTTILGRVGLLTYDGQVSCTDLGNAQIYSYAPMRDGILAQGVLYDESEQTCRPQTIRIDQNGQIVFQRNGAPYDIKADHGMLTSSICRASNDEIFVLESRGIPEYGWSAELICLDLEGQEKWRVAADSISFVNDLSVADGNVYLFGSYGEWDEKGLPKSKQAMIQCYSDEGVYQWTRQFASPEKFFCADAGFGVCVGVGIENDIWYLSVISKDGTVQKMAKIDAQAQYINKPYFISDETLVLLGMTDEQLLICNITF